MTKQTERKRIGLFLPYLCGFYLGSIVEEFRRACSKFDFDLITVMTKSDQFEYEDRTAIDHIDAAFIAVDTLSKQLVEELISREIPVVSATNEYFPLDVDVVTSHQFHIIEQAFDHLCELGHRKIGFVGNLAITDFRLRYESLLECYRNRGLNFDENWLFSVDNSGMAGGTRAINDVLERGMECTAIICGSDLMAMGLTDALDKQGIKVPQQLAIVGIDNTSAGRHHNPSITSVDQKIPQMVEQAVLLFINRWNDDNSAPQTVTVNPQLHIRQSSSLGLMPNNQGEDKRLIAHYMQDDDELAMALGGLDYQWIIDLSMMWGPFYTDMFFSDWHKGQADSSVLRLTKVVGERSLEQSQLQLGETFIPEQFPPMQRSNNGFPVSTTLFPINAGNQKFSVIAIVDDLRPNMDHVAQNMFNYYTTLMTNFQENEALYKANEKKEQSARKMAEHLEVITNSSSDGVWIWDLKTNHISWNKRSLEMLGFQDEAEHKNYGSIPFFERIHPQDLTMVKNSVKETLNNGILFNSKYRIQTRNGEYIWVIATGNTLKDADGKTTHFVGALNNITENLESQEKIEFLAYHDLLTQLPNRHSITETISHKIINNPDQPFILCLLDLNRFKIINDTLGHLCGDQLLQHVADQISLVLRKCDIVARFGGDEFILLLNKNEDKDAIQSIAQRLNTSIGRPFIWQGKEMKASASLGIAYYPDHGCSMNDLIKKADVAMYEAKKESKAFAIYDAHMEKISQSFKIESLLKHAIQNDEFSVVIQPIVNSQNGSLKGGELLLRWHSTELGNIPPAIFIPIAEETGLIISIGDWVLRKALSIIKDWETRGLPFTYVSVNVSNLQLMLPQFAKTTCDLIRSYGISPNKLTIEITESIEITERKDAFNAIEELRAIGCQIAFDDFGTGYSSLSLLYDLPVDIVKLDRSLIQSLDTEKKRSAMVKSLISMCHSLDYIVVAEGIEHETEANVLSALHCDLSQGYYYSKPISLEGFETQFLQSHNQS
jgi:diguanylate cyclase (GGDEF)-like protein/PAS domain S-box-containing protein